MSLNLQTMVRSSKILCISMILLAQWMLIMTPTPARSAVIHTNENEDKIKPKLNGQSNSIDLVDKVKLLMQFSTAIGTDSTVMAAASAFGTVFEIAAVDKLWNIGRELSKISELDNQNQNTIEYAKYLLDSTMQCQKSYLDSWINESCSKLNMSDPQQIFCDNYHSSEGIILNLTCSNAPTSIKCSRSEDGSLAWSAIPQCHQPGDWSSWSDCSQTCGNGTRTRQRSWPHKPEEIQHETCNVYCCFHNTTGQQVAVGQEVAVGQTLGTATYCPGDHHRPGDVLTCTENGFIGQDLVRPSSCPWPISSYGCIKIPDDKELSWCDARKACREMDAVLVSPDSEADYAALADYLTQRNGKVFYWTSATNRLGQWEYTSGNNRLLGDGVAQDWWTGLPSTIGAGTTKCGVMFQEAAYKLGDNGCDYKSHFICEIKTTTTDATNN